MGGRSKWIRARIYASAAAVVAAGQDRYGERRGLGISEIAFKVTPADSAGVLVLENTFRARGGPARHLHHDQDEWFYAVEGEFAMEIGAERFTLQAGDSVVGPKATPHVWAYTGKPAARNRTDLDRVFSGRQDGGVFPRGHRGKRHAAPRP